MRSLTLATFIVFLTLAVAGQIKKPQLPAVRPSLASSRQLIVVTSPDWNSITATARLFERRYTRAPWIAVGKPFPVVLGRSGLRWSEYDVIREHDESVPFKTEGDGASPAGAFPLTFVFSPDEKIANSKIDYRRIEEFTECVDDPHSTHYNKIVNRMQVGNFDWKSSEKMIRIRPEYDLGVFVAYNSYLPRGGHGSCIFLHIWKNAATSTAGCTAMERSNLERIVGWLDAKKAPYLVQLPEAKYNELRPKGTWKPPKLK